jgi:two-component system, sensor histidine kinase PdtaS
MTKDATIREIHHRVKNNLQTVAALLRLQARRLQVPEGRDALEEAVRRVGSIAIVHETLSQAVEETVDFDAIADRLARLVTDVGLASVRVRREGRFGMLVSELATPLAMVLTELLQNAVEHGYPLGDAAPDDADEIVLSAQRRGNQLEVCIDDNGRGLPEGFELDGSPSLGLSIVKTLVESELGGHLTLGASPTGGTRADLSIPLD